MTRHVFGFMLYLACLLGLPAAASATAVQASCARPNAGATVARPPDVYSSHGTLKLALRYVTGMDEANRTLFCFITTDGQQSPTLHVDPGDTIDISVTNDVPPLPAGSPSETISGDDNVCGDRTMTGTSVNMHFHGTNTAPTCHSDEVIHTLINSGHTFRYHLQIPSDEPPGLYWYHPHVHGIAESALLGGASGAIVVRGIQNLQPSVVGLPERILVVRDQVVGASPVAGKPVPAWDVSLNYVPVSYPSYTPAVLDVVPGQKEFWRVVNASADTILDLQVRLDGNPQPLELVGLDGVPTGSQDGTRRGKIVTVSHILMPPAARAEFIVAPPRAGGGKLTLVTQKIDTGPDGDFDPHRVLAVLHTAGLGAAKGATLMAMQAGPVAPQRFEGLDAANPATRRKLYFSEVLSDPSDPASPTNFFITVEGATPVLFDPTNPPAITTTQGSVEDWTIENRTGENHEFHMHQIHFELLKQDGVPVSADQRQMLDMIQVPYWKGKGPYPSVTVRMDFRGPDVGDFVYHCHILGHEDNGMMAIIRVLPRS